MSNRVRSCRFCGMPVRYRPVIVGTRSRRKLVVLTIDAHPHSEGRVVEHADGGLQLLVPWAQKDDDMVAYRVHSRRECADSKKGTHD